MKVQSGLIILSLALGALAGSTGTGHVLHAGTTPVASMTIREGTSYRVLHDGKNSYNDYRISSPDTCVEGYINSTGMAFMRLNRKIGETFCNQADPVAYPDNVGRQVRLIIGDPTACQELRAAALYENDSDGAPCVFDTPVDTATQPHVRLETVFKNKATRTPVQFQFQTVTRAYHVRADFEASIIGSADSKVVTYGRTATLYGHTGSAGSAWEAIGQPFTLPFELVLMRQYVTN